MVKTENTFLKPWCIAIIDEDLDDRIEIRRMLLNGSDRRIRFVEAGTAEAGIKIVLGMANPPDCIVLDYDLPEMEAPEVLAALTGIEGMPVCPVVVLTGSVSPQEGRRVLRAGAQDYIGKDCANPASLVRAIENASESWAMARELRLSKSSLQGLNDRETFRSRFGDAIRGLSDEHALKHVASRLLGLHLKVNRVTYGEVSEEGMIVVGSSYVNELPQMAGIYSVNDYGPLLLPKLMSGETLVVHDVREEGRVCPAGNSRPSHHTNFKKRSVGGSFRHPSKNATRMAS